MRGKKERIIEKQNSLLDVPTLPYPAETVQFVLTLLDSVWSVDGKIEFKKARFLAYGLVLPNFG